MPAGHSWIALAEVRLGACLTKLKRLDEARPRLEHNVPLLEKALGGSHPRAIDARSSLCSFYEAAGQDEKLNACRAILDAVEVQE